MHSSDPFQEWAPTLINHLQGEHKNVRLTLKAQSGSIVECSGLFKTQNLVRDDASGASALVDQDTLWITTQPYGYLVTEHDSIVIDGRGYKATQPRLIDDGLYTAIYLDANTPGEST